MHENTKKAALSFQIEQTRNSLQKLKEKLKSVQENKEQIILELQISKKQKKLEAMTLEEEANNMDMKR